MAKHNQPPRDECSILAAGLAVAGTLLLSDKLSSLAHGALTLTVVLQGAGILMIASGICLLLAEWPARTGGRPTAFRERSSLNAKGSRS